MNVEQLRARAIECGWIPTATEHTGNLWWFFDKDGYRILAEGMQHRVFGTEESLLVTHANMINAEWEWRQRLFGAPIVIVGKAEIVDDGYEQQGIYFVDEDGYHPLSDWLLREKRCGIDLGRVRVTIRIEKDGGE